MSVDQACIWWLKWSGIPWGYLRFSKISKNHYFLLGRNLKLVEMFNNLPHSRLCHYKAFLKLKFQSQRLIPLIQSLSKELSPFRTNIFQSRCLAVKKLNNGARQGDTDLVLKECQFLDNFPLIEQYIVTVGWLKPSSRK